MMPGISVLLLITALAQNDVVQQAANGNCSAALSLFGHPQPGRSPNRLERLATAQCLTAEKRFDAADGIMGTLMREFPDDADVLYISAELHRRAWNESLYRLYKSAPGSFRVNQISAEVFEMQSRFTDAIAEYRKAIAKNPRAIDLHYRLGRAILFESHEASALERARKEFETELTLNPQDAAAEYQIAQILVAQQHKSEAATHFERAAQLRPSFPEALIAVGKLRSEAKLYPQSIALFERAAKLQPRNEAAHYNLMLAYRNAGKPSEAQREKTTLEKLQQPPEGEFSDFLKRLGEKPAQ